MNRLPACGTSYSGHRVKSRWLLLLLFSAQFAYGQISLKDSSASFPMIGATIAGQIPGGDMADRFYPNFNVGGVFQWKLKNNFIFGLEGNFLFRDKVREAGILDSLKPSGGTLIAEIGRAHV